jgi:ABC-2 type transport system permease protein
MTTFVLLHKELKSLFSSWMAYVVLITFTLLTGIVFYATLDIFEQAVRWASSAAEGESRASWNLVDQLIVPLYRTVFMLLFMMVPAITMRLFAEEKKQRTNELLLTSPVRIPEIVLAKYFAAGILITLMLLPVAIFPGLIIHYSRPSPDWGPMVTGYGALFLLAYSLAAIGVFASSLTENQIVAYIIALALEMLFFLIAQASIMMDVIKIGGFALNIGALMRNLSLEDHLESLLAGLVKLDDLVYFAILIVFWLWATGKSVESARWA